jgi:glutathione S-transferase
MSSNEKYIIYGAENSPYSIKVRSYARYKKIPHEWKTDIRHGKTQKEYEKIIKLPLVPAVALPTGEGMQDSTPIMEYFDHKFPNSVSTHPPYELKFISILLEEFGDEWGNKWMFHYRWARPIDQRIVSLRLAFETLGDQAKDEMIVQVSDFMRKRMSGRGFAVGSNSISAPLIERSFIEGIKLLEKHLLNRSYLFGNLPSFGDFGLSSQIYQALLDPTAGKHLVNHAPRVVHWCTRMLAPDTFECQRQSGKGMETWETWESLSPTLLPFLKEQVGNLFLKWSSANSVCILNKRKECIVELKNYGTWKNKVGGPQKYQHKSLQVLRKKYAEERTLKLDNIMKQANCFNALVLAESSTSKL